MSRRRKIQIDGSEFFDGCGLLDGSDQALFCVRGVNQATIDGRNQSIIEAWACPERRRKQSEATKNKRARGETRHSLPEYKTKITAKMKSVYEDPAIRKKISDAKKKYWENWRAERARSLH